MWDEILSVENEIQPYVDVIQPSVDKILPVGLNIVSACEVDKR